MPTRGIVYGRPLPGFVLFMFTSIMGWSAEEVRVYIAALLKQLRDQTIHGFFHLRNVYAQKPDVGKGDDVSGSVR